MPAMASFDDAKVEQGVRLILEGIGEDLERGGLKDTPPASPYVSRDRGRVGADATGIVTVVEGADFDEMIMVRDIPLYSICEHHLIPFNGRAHVAYVPNKAGQITGPSKIARVVDVLAKKPQVQERPRPRSPTRSSARSNRAGCSSRSRPSTCA